jgi:transposase
MDPQRVQDTQDQAMARNGTTGATSVGIDVSKARLDGAARPPGDAWQSNNDESGIAALVERLQVRAPQLIVLEATGDGW